MKFSISSLVSTLDPYQARQRIAGPIWKMSCNNLLLLHCTQFPKKTSLFQEIQQCSSKYYRDRTLYPIMIIKIFLPKESLSCNILYVIRTFFRFICIIRFLANFHNPHNTFLLHFYISYFSYVEQKVFPFPCQSDGEGKNENTFTEHMITQL